MKIKVWDVIIIVGSIAFSFLPSILKLSMISNVGEQTATISVSGNRVKSLSLNSNGIFEFTFNGKVGYVEVSDKKIRMIEMDKLTCPEGVCSETGWIGKNYETIVCLPNRIVVSVENAVSDIDVSTN